jgi:hypothetical protein
LSLFLRCSDPLRPMRLNMSKADHGSPIDTLARAFIAVFGSSLRLDCFGLSCFF